MTLLVRRDVDEAEVGDHLLVHDPRQRWLHALNATARAVWDACATAGSPEDVVSTVADAFGVAAPSIDADVRSAIGELATRDLLALHRDPTSSGRPRVPDTTDGRTTATTTDDAPEEAVGDGGEPPDAKPAHPELTAPDGCSGGDGLHVALLGWRAAVTVPDESLAARLADVLHGVATVGPVDHRYELVALAEAPVESGHPDAGGAPDAPAHPVSTWRLTFDGAVLREDESLERTVAHLLWHLNDQAVATTAAWLLLHAGAVVGPGGVVAIAGEPDAGKSTLTAAAVCSGLGYVTDEATAIDLVDHLVTPYPKPVTLDGTAIDLLARVAGGPDPAAVSARSTGIGDRHLDPRLLGATATARSPLAAVVLPDRHGPAERSPHRLAPVDAALALGQVAFNLDRTRGVGLAALAALARTVPVMRVASADLAATVAVVRHLAGAEPQAGRPRREPRPDADRGNR